MDLQITSAVWDRVFDNGPVSIFMWENITGEWPVSKVTKNVKSLTGWSDDEFLGGEVNYADLIHKDDLSRVSEEEDEWKNNSTAVSVNMNYRMVTKSGDVRHVSEYTQRIKNEDGEVSHLVGYLIDVTDHWITVQERDIAETAERAKAEFLANMSHEIRTPMNGVMGMAELLSRTELNSKQKMYADVILNSGASLLTIINDILYFSKTDAGQMELDPAPFVLAEAVEDVATLVSSKVVEKGLELIVRVDPSIPKMIVGDVGRIRQIITNLLGNAVKFTEKGHININVEGKLSDTCEMIDLEFSVEDTGIGIPKEKCALIFDKFSQVDTSATRKHEGAGLGLSIAHSLVDLMGGEIKVESQMGLGSTFSFNVTVPVHGDVVPKPVIPGDLSGSRILVIDDNDINRSILREQMIAWNFDSAAANSGDEGLEVMHAVISHGLPVDLVILDYQMPGKSGEEVLEIMRHDEKLANIPVIMLTSVDSSQTNKRLNQLGAEANLTKPTRASVLLETILQVMAEKKSSPGNRSEATEQSQNEVSSQCDTEPDSAEPVFVERSTGCFEELYEGTGSDPATFSGGDIDILVAEDNEVNQILFEQILSDSGHRFAIVENGKLAVKAYQNRHPQLILMDVSMPEMNGREATAAIREIEQNRRLQHIPIIGVTAHALRGDRKSCIDAGMDDYLSKPVSPVNLIKKIDHWLGWRLQGEEPVTA